MKKLNRKTFLTGISVLFAIIIIIITSVLNAGLNPDNWNSTEFLSNLIITIAIGIFGVISGQGMGDNYFRTNEKGLFVSTYNSYNTMRTKINVHIDKFEDWNKRLYAKEYYQKCVRYLKNNYGIKQAELILELDKNQVLLLEQPRFFETSKGKTAFNSLTKEQIKAARKVLTGKIKMKYVHDSYFLNAYSKNKTQSMYEIASEQSKKQRQKYLSLMFYRVMVIIVFGFIMSGLVIDTQDPGGFNQAMINLISRLFTLFTSLAFGTLVASDLIKDECIYLDYKTTMLERFLIDVETNKFTAKSEEEKAIEKMETIKNGQKSKDNILC